MSSLGASCGEPVFGFRFRGTAAFDPYETRVSSATTDVYYEAERWRAGFGTRHGDNGELAFIQAYVQARLGRRWALRFSTDYNVDTSTVIENRFELDFWEQCWASARRSSTARTRTSSGSP